MESKLTIHLDKSEKDLLFEYARSQGMTASEFVRSCVLEKIEDLYDASALERALAELDPNERGIAHADIMKEFGITHESDEERA